MARELLGPFTLQNNAQATGTGTAYTCAGQGVVTIAINGTFSATISFEVLGPDGNWYQRNAENLSTGAIATTTTSSGLYEISARGVSAIRANITVYTSGAINASAFAQEYESGQKNVSLTGSNAEFKYQQGNVAAGATVSLYLDTLLNVDLTVYKQIQIGVNAADTLQHSFNAQLQYFESGFTVNAYSKFGSTSINTGNVFFAMSAAIDYITNHLLLTIQNNDTAPHPYNIVIKLRK